MTVRVLIADDQQLVRVGFRLILERQPGIEVAGEATSGAEAVALARQIRPDVVLMDIRMPGLDGIQATRLIRAEPATADTRVIILTTFDLDEYVYDALRARRERLPAQRPPTRAARRRRDQQPAGTTPSSPRPSPGASSSTSPRPADHRARRKPSPC